MQSYDSDTLYRLGKGSSKGKEGGVLLLMLRFLQRLLVKTGNSLREGGYRLHLPWCQICCKGDDGFFPAFLHTLRGSVGIGGR